MLHETDLFVKSDPDKLLSESVLTDNDPKQKEEEEPAKEVLCRFCRYRISEPKYVIPVNGSTKHIFANPHGLVFEIICVKEAPGCSISAGSSTEFTWFPGHRWHVALCRSCMNHIGWFFVSDTHAFYGLILDRLIF